MVLCYIQEQVAPVNRALPARRLADTLCLGIAWAHDFMLKGSS